MPRPRFQRLTEEKRLAILEAAGKEFAANGYEGASLNQIIATSGISKGAMYYYFDGKGDLFATVFRYAEEQLLDRQSIELDALTCDTFWPALERMTHHKEHFLEDHPWLMGMSRAFHQMPEELWTEGEMGEYLSEVHTFLRALLTRGQEVGALRRDIPVDLMLSLWMAVDQVFDRWVLDQWEDHTIVDEEWDHYVAMGMELFRRMALPVPGEEPCPADEEMNA